MLNHSLRHLQNYTTLKLDICSRPWGMRLRHLQNYTTLKLAHVLLFDYSCLRHLQNYTTLKPQTPNTSPKFQSLSSHHQV